MITGDNPLTACHVAKELRFSKDKPIAILTKVDNSACDKKLDSVVESDNLWQWQTVDGINCHYLPENGLNKKEFKQSFSRLTTEYALCLTGEGLTFLQKNKPQLHEQIIPHVKVSLNL